MEATYATTERKDMESLNKNLYIDNITKNCFFFWSHALILILTAIPIVNYLISKILHTPLWSIPKVYELKMYALAVLLCLMISIFGSNYTIFFAELSLNIKTIFSYFILLQFLFSRLHCTSL